MPNRVTSISAVRSSLLNRTWHVAGIVEPGKLSHVFLPIAVLQDAIGSPGKVIQIYLKLDNPKNMDAALDALKATFTDYPIYSMEEYHLARLGAEHPSA